MGFRAGEACLKINWVLELVVVEVEIGLGVATQSDAYSSYAVSSA